MAQSNRRDYLKYLGFKVAFAQTSLKELKTNPPQMTPNDKPLPAEILKEIRRESFLSFPDKDQGPFRIGYQDGATAWAGWKVRFDELQVQAQRMADVLELTKASISSLIKPAYWNQEISDEQRELIKTRNTIETTLQQFKDGREVEDA